MGCADGDLRISSLSVQQQVVEGCEQPFESCETFALSQHLYKLVRQRIEAGFMRVVDCTS